MAPDLLAGELAPGTTRVAWELGDRLLVMLFNDTAAAAIVAAVRVPAGYRILTDDGRGRIEQHGRTLSASVEPLDCRWAIVRR